MTSITQLSPEFARSTSGWVFQPTSSTPTSITGICYAQVTFDMAATSVAPSIHGVSISTLVEQRERDPRKAAAYERARKRIAARITGGAATLAQLRLAKGMSQAQLAEAMGTKQPYVARLEGGDNDVKMSTISTIAKALSIPVDQVFAAVMNSRQKQEVQL